MDKRKKIVSYLNKGVEVSTQLLVEKHLPLFILPLTLVVWVIEKWVFSFSNWVPLVVTVWATIQAIMMATSTPNYRFILVVKFGALFQLKFFQWRNGGYNTRGHIFMLEKPLKSTMHDKDYKAQNFSTPPPTILSPCSIKGPSQ
ncbi:hypothetical protein CsSME_00037955 [Camellia sinensis var. sinensis]